jgi:hypothetical protein
MHLGNLHFAVYDANDIVYISANAAWVVWMFWIAGKFPRRNRSPRHGDNSATLSRDMRNESCLLITKWHSQENSPVTGNEEQKWDGPLKKKGSINIYCKLDRPVLRYSNGEMKTHYLPWWAPLPGYQAVTNIGDYASGYRIAGDKNTEHTGWMESFVGLWHTKIN